MIMFIGIVMFLLLLNNYWGQRLSSYSKIFSVLICLSPVFVKTEFLSLNFILLVTSILVLNLNSKISFYQALMMIISVGSVSLGLKWNDAILLTFLASYFDQLKQMSGREKILLLTGGIAIYSGIEFLALVFIILSSISFDKEKIETALVRYVVLISSFTFFDINSLYVNAALVIYTFLVFFASYRENEVNVFSGLLITYFLVFKFEYSITFVYIILTYTILLQSLSVALRDVRKLDFLKTIPSERELIVLISIVALSFSWSSTIVYTLSFFVLLRFGLARLSAIDFKNTDIKKSFLLNLLLYLAIFQPTNQGFYFFGFRKLVGFNITGENSYIPTLVMCLVFVVIVLLYNKLSVEKNIKDFILKLDLKNFYRVKYFRNSLNPLFIGGRVNDDQRNKTQEIKILYSNRINVIMVIVYTMIAVLYLTIEAVIKL